MKSIFLTNLMISISCAVYSQETTSYGTDAGTGGDYNSFFGYSAGTNTTGNENTGLGYSALHFNTIGTRNTAVGKEALKGGGEGCTAVGFCALRENGGPHLPDAGMYNTAIGYGSMAIAAYGDYNTAVGAGSLTLNYYGSNNTAIGYQSMQKNHTGVNNTATGFSALFTNQFGTDNTANGYNSLLSNTGSNNTAIGSRSMNTNTTGYHNTTVGAYSLYSNTTGYYNTATGSYSMNTNISGNFNMATGYYSLYSNTTGVRNSASGFRSMDSNTTGSNNTANGSFALDYVTTGSYNSALGYNSGPTLGNLNNTTALGYLAVPTASNQVRIGNTSVTSIGGQEGWTEFSDGRFKRDIKEDVSGLDFINQLRPVSYVVDKAGLNKFLHVVDSAYQAEPKSTSKRQAGFVAQEVESVVTKSGYTFNGVDAPENENDPYGIRYSAFVVPLVKAVQELTAKVEEQQQQIELLLTQLNLKSDEPNINTTAFLLQNSPNPFTTETEIKMTLPESVHQARVMIYNLEGKELKNIQVDGRGNVSVKIRRNELSAGMYLYTLIADGKIVNTKRMILTP